MHISPKYITTSLMVSILLNSPTFVFAANDDTEEIKKLSGISIVGNKEAPKSLYIIPWQNTELKHSAQYSSELIKTTMQPLDHETFRLQLQLYKLSNTNHYQLTP